MNEKQLMLYYGIGKYISLNSRKGFCRSSFAKYIAILADASAKFKRIQIV